MKDNTTAEKAKELFNRHVRLESKEYTGEGNKRERFVIDQEIINMFPDLTQSYIQLLEERDRYKTALEDISVGNHVEGCPCYDAFIPPEECTNCKGLTGIAQLALFPNN